ncbi:MAG: class I SAM-dependent methyltransferase [Candidatus Velthaea sp.]|jgi:SAM-dependent methyltransferase
MRVDLIGSMHAATKRDYVARVVDFDKAACAEVAGRFAADYWDGERQYGYGGYRYDGRWAPFAKQLVARYGLRAGHRVLDVGCGKGFLLHELLAAVPGLEVAGIDVSSYALEHATDEVRPYLTLGDAARLPYADGAFDLVISLATLHNLPLPELWAAIAEIERVGSGSAKYLMVESYRDEREKANLLYWQLTCKSFYSVSDWEWLYHRIGYRGDYDFIFFT